MKSGTTEEASTSLPADQLAWIRRPEIRRLLALFVLGACAVFLLHATPLRALLGDVQELRLLLEGDDWWAEFMYLCGVVCLVALGAPRLIFYVVGGIAFDFWEGLILAQVGTVVGSFITFQVVRWGGKEWVLRRYGERRLFRRTFLKPASVEAVALIRQLPITGVVINIGLALGHVTVPRFLLGSFIGFLPQGVIATLVGSGLADDQFIQGLGQILVAALIALAVALLIWRHARGKVVHS